MKGTSVAITVLSSWETHLWDNWNLKSDEKQESTLVRYGNAIADMANAVQEKRIADGLTGGDAESEEAVEEDAEEDVEEGEEVVEKGEGEADVEEE